MKNVCYFYALCFFFLYFSSVLLFYSLTYLNSILIQNPANLNLRFVFKKNPINWKFIYYSSYRIRKLIHNSIRIFNLLFKYLKLLIIRNLNLVLLVGLCFIHIVLHPHTQISSHLHTYEPV